MWLPAVPVVIAVMGCSSSPANRRYRADGEFS